ncbi:hypothetical protein AB1484_32280 [Parafrankia sp. FMc6]|uniref:hypothetical protein n=1 Tax=Parafrankia soli TaxID=2599596 RepID=UPI0034D72210
MALDPTRIRQAVSEAGRSTQSMIYDVRRMDQNLYSLGGEFRNQKPYSHDYTKIRDEIRNIERSLDRLKSLLNSVERTAR